MDTLNTKVAFTLGARAQYPSTVRWAQEPLWLLLGANVNTPFFQVSTLEFGHGAGARVQSLDLVLGHKSGHRVLCAHRFY